jgi:undecaprenyl diphosphate synthase
MVKHLALIMDGNRRWAKRFGLSSLQGHREGIGAIERTIQFCLAEGIEILSLYAFSIENLKRSKEETDDYQSDSGGMDGDSRAKTAAATLQIDAAKAVQQF